MKYIYLLLFLPLLSACNRNKYTEISGTVTGFNSGTVIVKDADNNDVATANVEGGKFYIKKILGYIGFYRLRIISDEFGDHRRPGYDVYLEPGTYTVNAVPEEDLQYPTISSSSPTQNELSVYYAIANKKGQISGNQIKKINALGNGDKLSKKESSEESVSLDTALKTRDEDKAAALEIYISQNPKNNIEAHIMAQLDYSSNPVTYNRIYQQFNHDEKESTEGVVIGDKLADLMKLEPGATAPQLLGNTPEGKAFDPKTINKKVILVEFWRADDDISRENHKSLVLGSFNPVNSKNFAIISVSLDTDRTIWANAIEQDGIKWMQISDLKGEKSPNVNSWDIEQLPTYYLVSGDWKIIKKNIDLMDIADATDNYLKIKGN